MPIIQNGKFSFHWDEETSFLGMQSGNGAREFHKTIAFSNAFKFEPNVTLNCTSLDAYDMENTRYTLEQHSISEREFGITLRVWGDSRVFHIGGEWLAYDSRLSSNLTRLELTD